MNRSLDKIVKQAKRTGRKVARRLSLSETGVLKKVVEKRESEQETRAVRVWGPYQESPTKFRLKIAEKGIERSLVYRTLEEAEAVKAELLRKHSHIQQITVHEALMEWPQYLEECRGIKPRSAKWLVQISRYWLPLHRPLSHITELDAKQLYTEHVRTPKSSNEETTISGDSPRATPDGATILGLGDRAGLLSPQSMEVCSQDREEAEREAAASH
jgi:hypothetical protein